MDYPEKLPLLEAATTEFLSPGGRIKKSKLYGVSNSAKVIGGGVQIGLSNLDNLANDIETCTFYCLMKFFPDEEVYFAIHVTSGLQELHSLLVELTARAGESPFDGFEYAGRNNNVAIALAHDGRLYLRNKGHWEDLQTELSQTDRLTSLGIPVESITVAFFPPKPGVARSQLAREFVGYLGAFVGKEKVHELHPWPIEGGVSDEMKRDPLSIPITEIKAGIEAQGGYYPGNIVERYHLGLTHNPEKHFVILSGISGTGKSRITTQYARAVHGITDPDATDPFLFMCPVRPEWTDPTGLIGYFDLLTDRYIVPPFLEAIVVALTNPETPVFVCLDEMNLATVEYYLSDILSAMESGHPMQLHSSTIPVEGSIGGEIHGALELPKNLYITGTINIDETVKPISDKVFDRAVVIDMSEVDISGFLDTLAADPKLKDSVDQTRVMFESLYAILSPNNQGFGYRIVRESILYYQTAVEALGRGHTDIVDELLTQKLLVKIHGDENQRVMLEQLSTITSDYPLTTGLLRRLEDDLNTIDSFQNSR